TVILVNRWRGLPFFAITLLAGLVAIRRELYEAAESDGAGSVARFWHITVPLLKPVLAVVILFSAIFTLADFNIVYILTKGGPMNMTHLFATYSFALGLQGGQIGQGAAASLFLFPTLLGGVPTRPRRVRQATALVGAAGRDKAAGADEAVGVGAPQPLGVHAVPSRRAVRLLRVVPALLHAGDVAEEERGAVQRERHALLHPPGSDPRALRAALEGHPVLELVRQQPARQRAAAADLLP